MRWAVLSGRVVRQWLCGRAISIQFAYKKDGSKGERHGRCVRERERARVLVRERHFRAKRELCSRRVSAAERESKWVCGCGGGELERVAGGRCVVRRGRMTLEMC